LSLSHKILLWPTRHPCLALALGLVVTVFFAAQIPSLRKDIRHEKSFPDKDPRLEAYNSFKENFGADDETAFCLLDMGGKKVTKAENIARIYKLTEKLDQLDFVDSTRLTSLSRAVLVRVIDEDTLELEPLYEPKRKKTWKSKQISGLLAEHPVFRERLISKDEELAAFLIPIHPSDLSDTARKAFAKKIKQFFKDELKPEEKVYFEGFAMTKWDLLGLVADDFKTFFPLSLLSLICALFLIFRRVEAVVLSLLTVIVSAIWTLGAMVLLDIPMTFISTAIPAMILVVCVGDSIYLFSRFYQFINTGLAKREALEGAIKAVGQACFFTSVTTAAGFASLAFNPIEIIRELGIPVAIGVFVAYVTTFLILPPFIAWVPAPKPGQAKGGTQFLEKPLRALSEFV
ncbi:MAG: MMPL family transporter, partial [Planctomycetota bacterium]|nr:MMPL family transporter [Planctomycetota bacterium]